MRFAPGARLGPFEIEAPLGAGGMGEVHRARDTRLDRTVAIKVLPSELAALPGPWLERFRREARAVARLTHPNICTLHDVGEDGSSIFLVMEHVDGATLARRLQDGPLPPAQALRIASQIADALDYAHRNGVVHRDLKPGNIMLTRDAVKLLDFGLAKFGDEVHPVDDATRTSLTGAGAIVGTVPYMSPEQVEGHDVDARSDIFSFGVVLYEMLCGRRPFAGDSRASLMAAIVNAEPPPMTPLPAQTPAALERVVRRCLAKDREDRWQTARDLAAELRWIAEPGSGTTTAPAAPVRRPRRAALWGALAGAALAAAALAAAAPWIWPRPEVAKYWPVTFLRGVVSTARFAPDGSIVYSASWEGQPYGVFHGRVGSGGDARDLQLKDGRILSISRAGEMAVLFGPQNIQQAFGERTLAHIPMAGGARRDVLTGIVDADWIPGTDTLAVVRDPGNGGLWTVEFPVGTKVHEARAAWSLRVSPDGSRVAFFEGPTLFSGGPQMAVTVVDRSGSKSTLARDLTGLGLAWAPSGREVWFTATRPSQYAPHLRAVSLSGVEREVHRAPDWLVLHDISASGTVLLARNTIRQSLVCRRPEDALERDLTWQISAYVMSLSADGKAVIFADNLNTGPSGATRLYYRNLDGSPAVPIGEGSGGAFSPDGKWVLASSEGTLNLLPVGAGERVTLPNGGLTRIRAGGWLSDSKRIVFTADPGDGKPRSRAYIQEVPAGAPRALTGDGVVLIFGAAVRDDQSLLAFNFSARAWQFIPVSGGEGRPVNGLRSDDTPLQWSHNGRYVYAAADSGVTVTPAATIFRVEPETGARVLWKTLTPSDPVGVENAGRLVLTPDAQTYCYSYTRRLGDLFVVDGLK